MVGSHSPPHTQSRDRAKQLADGPPCQLQAALPVKVRLSDTAELTLGIKGSPDNLSPRSTRSTSDCSSLPAVDEYTSEVFSADMLRGGLRPPVKPEMPRRGCNKPQTPWDDWIGECPLSPHSARTTPRVVPPVPLHTIQTRALAGPLYRIAPKSNQEESCSSRSSSCHSAPELGADARRDQKRETAASMFKTAPISKSCSLKSPESGSSSGGSDDHDKLLEDRFNKEGDMIANLARKRPDGRQRSKGRRSTWNSFVSWARPRRVPKTSNASAKLEDESLTRLPAPMTKASSAKARFMSNQSICSADWPATPRQQAS